MYYEVYIFYFKKLNNFLMILVYLFNNKKLLWYIDILKGKETFKTLKTFCSIWEVMLKGVRLNWQISLLLL